jgi:REP element-mobilizing transposase RayT
MKTAREDGAMRKMMECRAGVFHCISRTVAGAFLLGAAEKEMFRRMLWQVADFCGVEVLAYCVMSNHFHVLVRVKGDRAAISQDEILRRYAVLYKHSTAPGIPSVAVLKGYFAEGGIEAERWEARLRDRMDDVSSFMKTLKQRYSFWFNRSHQRFGTLWAERFRCVLVEDRPEVLSTVAAYIDLNAIRAGLVADPADYRWCSYAEAQAGRSQAAAGLAMVMGENHWAGRAREAYRLIVFGKGGEPARSSEESGKIAAQTVETVVKRRGMVTRSELLRCRVRYFTEGAALGSAAFVSKVGMRMASQKPSILKRKKLGKLPLEEASLVAWRNLQESPVTQPQVTQSGESP